MRSIFRSDFRSFYFLNATQFLGALNDNVFKLLVIYLLINLKGPSAANSILSLAGAIFVIPFLLFSSGAGVVADRISKRTIIVFTKAFEVCIMLFGMLAISLRWEVGVYTALFLMATQSAIFGPSKYGIIPELVETKMVSKANGSLTSFTYLAIILGTFLASFLTDISGKNFVLEASVCVLIAGIGLMASFGINRTTPQNSSKKVNPVFLYEIYQTLKFSWKIPHLLPMIYGSSFFLLYCFAWSLTMTLILLGLLGVFGGAYLIPFDSFLQLNSPKEKRGQVIAAANFFSFIGVLMASFALYLISEKLGFSAASGFFWMAMITFVSNVVTTGRLSGLFFPFFVNKILKRFRRLKLTSEVPHPSTIIILESNSWYDALLLFSCLPRLKLLIPGRYFRVFPWFNGLLESIQLVPPEPDMRSTLKNLFGQAKRFQGQNSSVCLFFYKREDSATIIDAYTKIFGKLNLEIQFAYGKTEKIEKRFLFFRYYQKQIILSFS